MSGGVTLILNCLRSGGAEKQLLWIAAQIPMLGIPCSIVELVAGERTVRIEGMVRSALAQGVRIVRAPAGGGMLGGFWRLGSHLLEVRPALIWSWGLRADAVALVGRLGGYRGKWVTSIRSANRKRDIFGSCLKQLLAIFCDGVVSNTQAGWDLSGFRNRGVRHWILPNAVVLRDAAETLLPVAVPQPVVIVMLGNIKVAIKGYDLAAKLARILREREFAFQLRIAGRPDEFEKLEALCSDLDVQTVIKFYGEVTNPEEFLLGGHLYLLLSRFEGMPNTLLEALAVGLPVIATDVGDLGALKQKGAPFTLIPVENVDAAAEAVEQAVARWADTRMVASRGRSWVQENFSEEACRAALQRILRELTVV